MALRELDLDADLAAVASLHAAALDGRGGHHAGGIRDDAGVVGRSVHAYRRTILLFGQLKRTSLKFKQDV